MPVSFSDLPDWRASDIGPATKALARSCARILRLPDGSPISRAGAYGGTAGDWRTACETLVNSKAEPSHDVLENLFRPVRIESGEGTSRLTGYFEPELSVRAKPDKTHSRAIPAPPDDLIRVTLSDFGDQYGASTFWGRLEGQRLKPYADRADITDAPDKAIAWAHPADVFYLQIQGSGRLAFPDGTVKRAAFAAHNAKPFKSIARHLIDEGEITAQQAGIAGVRAWMDEAGDERAQDAMNVNPRYVWFAAETLDNPNIGPRGAEGLPLTPMGSMAIDPAFHPYGVPLFLDTHAPEEPGDWKGQPFRQLVVAQDTGGAIKGVLRGDLFYGWGDHAGAMASNQNHEIAMWALLPTSVADALER